MENTQQQQSYSIEQLTQKVNRHDWSQYQDKLSKIPNNCVYRTVPQIPLQYQRLRTALMKNDLSLKSYDLTTLLLKSKTNNYYALMLRKEYVNSQLQTKQYDISSKYKLIEQELDFVNNLLNDNPKQYHLWTYKKDLLQQQRRLSQNSQKEQLINLRIFKKQLTFLTMLLLQDQRNYHAWDYRFWLVIFCQQLQQQFKWTSQILFQAQNISTTSFQKEINNIQGYQAHQIKINWKNVYSLWSYRQSLLRFRSNNKSKPQQILEQLRKVLEFLKIKCNCQNQCGWNYLLGLINFYELSVQNYQKIKSQIQQIPENRFKLQTILNIFRKQQQKEENKLQLRTKQIQILRILLEKDQVRKKYYTYLIEQLEK